MVTLINCKYVALLRLLKLTVLLRHLVKISEIYVSLKKYTVNRKQIKSGRCMVLFRLSEIFYSRSGAENKIRFILKVNGFPPLHFNFGDFFTKINPFRCVSIAHLHVWLSTQHTVTTYVFWFLVYFEYKTKQIEVKFKEKVSHIKTFFVFSRELKDWERVLWLYKKNCPNFSSFFFKVTTAAEAKQAGTFRRINIKILSCVVPQVRIFPVLNKLFTISKILFSLSRNKYAIFNKQLNNL